jgi:hypothetical protein
MDLSTRTGNATFGDLPYTADGRSESAHSRRPELSDCCVAASSTRTLPRGHPSADLIARAVAATT